MTAKPLFQLIAPQQRTESEIDIWFDDVHFRVPGGRSVAAALLTTGATTFRTTPISGAPRAPYCMMGVCFECLVEIDGKPSCQSCLVTVTNGMRIRTQHGARELTLTQEKHDAC
jgi:predicted molibdopterin-dependent oxidoreductase YjgC